MAQKTATTTLHATGATLLLTATMKADGSAMTTVTTIDADKDDDRHPVVGRATTVVQYYVKADD